MNEIITDGNCLADAYAGFLSKGKGTHTNFYGTAEELTRLAEGGKLNRQTFSGGFYLFSAEKNKTDLFYFLEKDAEPVPFRAEVLPVLLEQVALAGKERVPSDEVWQKLGFMPYVLRKRMFLSAKKTEAEERTASFAEVGDAEKIFSLMQNSFEPFTSALPSMEELKRDIARQRVIVKKEGEHLLGYLRFGRERKCSVLWQIAVSKESRGKGTAGALVRDWVSLERPEVLKFQLWVREDKPSALRLYEKTGFLPDGRSAPVMIKKENEQG